MQSRNTIAHVLVRRFRVFPDFPPRLARIASRGCSVRILGARFQKTSPGGSYAKWGEAGGSVACLVLFPDAQIFSMLPPAADPASIHNAMKRRQEMELRRVASKHQIEKEREREKERQ